MKDDQKNTILENDLIASLKEGLQILRGKMKPAHFYPKENMMANPVIKAKEKQK